MKRLYCEEDGMRFHSVEDEPRDPGEFTLVILGTLRADGCRCDTCNRDLLRGAPVCFLLNFREGDRPRIPAVFSPYIDPNGLDTRQLWQGRVRPE